VKQTVRAAAAPACGAAGGGRDRLQHGFMAGRQCDALPHAARGGHEFKQKREAKSQASPAIVIRVTMAPSGE
jgi:hypothetical protein